MYLDVYLLANERSEDVVYRFLDHFAPDREESQEDYGFPQYADVKTLVLRTAREAITHCCCKDRSAAQSIYWRRTGPGDPAHAMVFFTTDEHLILGLSTSERAAPDFLKQLKKHTRSRVGLILGESPPPDTAAEFRYLAEDFSL